MTKIINLDENISIKTIITLSKNGDEIILEENGKQIAKVTPIVEVEETQPKQRVLGLGKGKGYFMSDDFDDEFPDEFWGFDKDL